MTKRGQAKVLDFGLAKLLPKGIAFAGTDSSSSAQEPVSMVGYISGTPSYMSPEQIRGDDLDPRTDIFSFGLLLYEMTAGRQAFAGNTGGAIIEGILSRRPPPLSNLNPEVPARLEEIISRAVHKDREQRYQSAAEIREELKQLKLYVDSGHTVRITQPRSPMRKWVIAGCAAVVVLLGLAIAGLLFNARRARALSGTDTIVLADFNNKTGDAVFDDTLLQGLAVQLEQSPFLSPISDQRVQQMLQLMGRPRGTKLTPEIARDLCARTGSKAYLMGSISNMGSQYVIGINAVNCQTGDDLAQEQITADGKEHVLKALGDAATKLRSKLGESLKTIQKLDAPIDQATTPSLEALQAYSQGRKSILMKGDYTGAGHAHSSSSLRGAKRRSNPVSAAGLLRFARNDELWLLPALLSLLWAPAITTWAKRIWPLRTRGKPTNYALALVSGSGSMSSRTTISSRPATWKRPARFTNCGSKPILASRSPETTWEWCTKIWENTTKRLLNIAKLVRSRLRMR